MNIIADNIGTGKQLTDIMKTKLKTFSGHEENKISKNASTSAIYQIFLKDPDEIADIIIRFLKCPYIYNKEISILNKHAKDFQSLVAAFYTDHNIPKAADLSRMLSKYNKIFNVVASFDKKDEFRITLFCDGEKYNGFNIVQLNPFDYPDGNKIKEIAKYIKVYNNNSYNMETLLLN